MNRDVRLWNFSPSMKGGYVLTCDYLTPCCNYIDNLTRGDMIWRN